jgi:hypothetical protein
LTRASRRNLNHPFAAVFVGKQSISAFGGSPSYCEIALQQAMRPRWFIYAGSGAPISRSPTLRQAATTGRRRTTTAPGVPAQPARTTPLAHTTALASVVSTVIVAAKAKTAAAASKNATRGLSPDLIFGHETFYGTARGSLLLFRISQHLLAEHRVI